MSIGAVQFQSKYHIIVNRQIIYEKSVKQQRRQGNGEFDKYNHNRNGDKSRYSKQQMNIRATLLIMSQASLPIVWR